MDRNFNVLSTTDYHISFAILKPYTCIKVNLISAEPTVRCGDEEIEVAIDRELVRELEIDDNAQYVYFGHSSASNKCRAQVVDNSYILKIRAPYSSCGTQVIVSI